MVALHNSSSNDNALSNIVSLIQENYVSREEYDKLKKDFELLQQEHVRSKQIFQAKLVEWEAIKRTLSSSAAKNEIKTAEFEKEDQPHIPKAPRLGNKASKRIILGGDTPPGYWSTRFTPETWINIIFIFKLSNQHAVEKEIIMAPEIPTFPFQLSYSEYSAF